MNVYRFINSPDIQNYLRDISYQFTPIEAAWLINECRFISVEEKHAAWQELIDTMPDRPIKERLWTAARPSLHEFLKEYMQFQHGLIKELFFRRENEIYAGRTWRPVIEEVYPFSSVDRCLAECRKSFDDETEAYDIYKYQLDEPERYIIHAVFRAENGALMMIDQGQSFSNDADRTIFTGSFLHFPLPFKKGDILWNPHLSSDSYGGSPFVFLSAGLDVYPDEQTKARMLREAAQTDMVARGYEYSEYWGRITEEDHYSYMDLEYYTGTFEKENDRLLPALSDCLKAETNEREFWSDLSEAERKDILEAFFPSFAMRRYLLNEKLCKSQVLEMILGSPAPLTVKRDWLLKLSQKEPEVFQDALLLERLEEKTDEDLCAMIRSLYDKSFTAALADVEEALEQLKLRAGEILYLKECWYDDDLKDENASGTAPFLSFEKALDYIYDDMRKTDYQEGDTAWYVLEKWGLSAETGEMEKRFTYYLVGDRITWFEKMKWDKKAQWWMPESYDYSSASRSLSLAVPLKVGDIVLVDCTPFRPVKMAVIIEAGEGVMLQALFQNEDGKWRTGAVRNTSLFGSYPLMSSLYRMVRLVPGDNDGLLLEVRDTLAGKPARGAALWKMINEKRQSSGGLTSNEIRKILEKVKENL